MLAMQVLLIGDQRTFLTPLASALEQHFEASVVNVAVSPADGRSNSVAGKADVVLVDGRLGERGIALLAEYLDDGLADHAVLLIDGEDVGLATAALRAGALGVVQKCESLSALVAAVGDVASGKGRVPASMLGPVLTAMREQERLERAARDLLEELTPREREILACMVAGQGRSAIAKELYISVNTVRSHTQSLFRKLGVHSSIEAVTLAGGLGGSLSKHGSGSAP